MKTKTGVNSDEASRQMSLGQNNLLIGNQIRAETNVAPLEVIELSDEIEVQDVSSAMDLLQQVQRVLL